MLISLFISISLSLVTPNTQVTSTCQKELALTKEQVLSLNDRIDRVDRESSERYDRLASELDRDLSWIAVIVSLFSVIVGIVIPLVINSSYRKRFENDIKSNEDKYRENLSELNKKLDDFSREYSSFKQDYKISSLLDRALDTDDVSIRVDLYSKVLSLDPSNQIALLRRGIEYGRSGSIAESISDFKVLLSINPNDEVAYNNLGYSYFKAGDYKLAKEQYNSALAINPTYSTSLSNMANVLYKEGNYPLALEYIDRAINEKQDKILYHKRRRMILRKLSPRDEKAIEEETRIINSLEEENDRH